MASTNPRLALALLALSVAMAAVSCQAPPFAADITLSKPLTKMDAYAFEYSNELDDCGRGYIVGRALAENQLYNEFLPWVFDAERDKKAQAWADQAEKSAVGVKASCVMWQFKKDFYAVHNGDYIGLLKSSSSNLRTYAAKASEEAYHTSWTNWYSGRYTATTKHWAAINERVGYYNIQGSYLYYIAMRAEAMYYRVTGYKASADNYIKSADFAYKTFESQMTAYTNALKTKEANKLVAQLARRPPGAKFSKLRSHSHKGARGTPMASKAWYKNEVSSKKPMSFPMMTSLAKPLDAPVVPNTDNSIESGPIKNLAKTKSRSFAGPEHTPVPDNGKHN